jgi:hypothetical protein
MKMITKQEAKEKCIALWTEVARRVLIPEDQAKALVDDYVGLNMKSLAQKTLFPTEHPQFDCYLCEYFEHEETAHCWKGQPNVDFCPLATYEGCALYHHFSALCRESDWEAANMTALLIVRQVEKWT